MLLRFPMRAALAVALIGLVTACSSSTTPTGASTSGPPDILDEARKDGASREQLAVLEKSSTDVSFADYERAIGRTVGCLRDSGIDVVGDTVTTRRGFPEIRYSYANSSTGRSDQQTGELADTCMQTHSKWIEAAYQTSTRNIEAREALIKPYREALLACLRDNGGTARDDAPTDDLMIASSDVLEAKGINCWTTVGAPQ